MAPPGRIELAKTTEQNGITGDTAPGQEQTFAIA
jgi:hypothetical protein